MCLIDLNMDGNATLLDLNPFSEKTLEFTPGPDDVDVLENFDFDSFLQSPDHFSDCTFDAHSFTFGDPLLTSKVLIEDLGIPSPSVPVTPLHTTACFPQPQPKPMPVEMKNLQQFCIILGQNYLSKIVTIHNISKKVAGLDYPDVFQNQLLTASRTLTKLADVILEHHEIIQETGVLGALEGLVMECQYAIDRLNQDHSLDEGILSSDNGIAINTCKTYIKNSRLIAYECLVPLSKMLRALTCKSAEERRVKLLTIAAKYIQAVDAMDDSKTDVDDKRSILSGNTLMGVQEAKEKDLKVEAWEVEEDDDIEPTGCFFRMFFGRNKQPQQVTEVVPKRTLKSKLASAGSKIVPKKVKSIVAARESKKGCKLYGDVLKACNTGTVEELTKVLTRNRMAIAEVQNRPNQFVNATVSRDPEMLKCLLTHCGPLNVNAADHKERTPLYSAASYGKEEIVKILIAAGANKEAADKNGMRPLHAAAKRGHQDSITALLTAGANIEAPDAEMNKPLHYAVEHSTRCFGAICTLLNAGADINATNIKLSTPLHAAIRFNRPSAHLLLVQRGADIEALRIRWETPVKYAVSHGRTEMLRLLLASGANPNSRTCENKTALHSAAAHEDHEIVQVLLDAGCEVDPKGKNKSTPLYLAAQNGRIRSAQLLVGAGADLNAKRKGRTPIDIAKRYGNFGVVEVLEKAGLGLPCEPIEKVVEDHAIDHTCTWEQWFEKYVVATMEWQP